ncbi:MAG: hypothetical protein OEW93_01860 [Candidatus Bathyarchaeota archaeon]|nr:hypothetical protein [Candidatus Bathyarchaeota archaeon]
MATPRLVAEMFKGPTRPITNPVTDTVQTTATMILKNNPDRLAVLIVNLSANRGYLGFDRQVGPTRGIPVEASGGLVTMNWKEDAELVIQEVHAVNSVAAGTWYIVEVERC